MLAILSNISVIPYSYLKARFVEYFRRKSHEITSITHWQPDRYRTDRTGRHGHRRQPVRPRKCRSQ